jgi:hypothetical protein
MTDPLQTMLQQAGLATAAFPPTSRYHGIATAKLDIPNGESVIYLKRRLVPPPERFFLLQEHTVTEGERLDNITNQYLGDPEQFWRICDANGVMYPDELTETIGRRIRITLPEGITG